MPWFSHDAKNAKNNVYLRLALKFCYLITCIDSCENHKSSCCLFWMHIYFLFGAQYFLYSNWKYSFVFATTGSFFHFLIFLWLLFSISTHGKWIQCIFVKCNMQWRMKYFARDTPLHILWNITLLGCISRFSIWSIIKLTTFTHVYS